MPIASPPKSRDQDALTPPPARTPRESGRAAESGSATMALVMPVTNRYTAKATAKRAISSTEALRATVMDTARPEILVKSAVSSAEYIRA